jgi:flavin reductase (DIM6/NTAB) family NADH-FMN oxidoreductase RutF
MFSENTFNVVRKIERRGRALKQSVGAKTMLYPTPVVVVGTYDKQEKPNMMTAAWVGICCSKPPCIAVSLRKATYTYSNIVEQRAFTINIPSEKYVKETDYIGIASGKKVDKFSATKLTPVRSDLVNAPYVKEFPLVLECRLLQTIEIGLHTQFIGEIVDTKAEDTILEKGVPDMKKINPILIAPEAWMYYGVGNNIGKAFSIGKQI